MVNSYPETPDYCPDTPNFVSGHSGPGVSRLTWDTLKNISGFLAHKYLYGCS
jgi:hypothetical protein